MLHMVHHRQVFSTKNQTTWRGSHGTAQARKETRSRRQICLGKTDDAYVCVSCSSTWYRWTAAAGQNVQKIVQYSERTTELNCLFMTPPSPPCESRTDGIHQRSIHLAGLAKMKTIGQQQSLAWLGSTRRRFHREGRCNNSSSTLSCALAAVLSRVHNTKRAPAGVCGCVFERRPRFALAKG